MTTMTETAYAAGVPLPARVGALRALQQTGSLAWRTLVQIKHNPFELMDFSIQPIMFLLLFVYVFGGALGGTTHDYLQYVLAGIIVQNSLFTTMNTAIGLATDLQKGFSSRLRALVLLFAVGSLMGFRAETGPLAILGAAGLVLVLAIATCTRPFCRDEPGFRPPRGPSPGRKARRTRSRDREQVLRYRAGAVGAGAFPAAVRGFRARRAARGSSGRPGLRARLLRCSSGLS
jgi:hypothetical protein